MGDKTIDNPSEAFALPGATITGPPGSTSYRYIDAYNSGASAIAQFQWVALDVTGTSGHWFGVVKGVHGATINQCIGIAIDAIPVAGYGRIVVQGAATGLAGAAGVTAGNLLSPSTVSTDDGELVAASSPTAGQVIGIALQTQATHGGQFFMVVFKA